MNIKRIEIGFLSSFLAFFFIAHLISSESVRLITIILGFLISIAYFGFSWLIFSGARNGNLFHSIGSGILYSIAITGLTFKAIGFIGFSPLLLTSSFFLLVLILPSSLILKSKNPFYFADQVKRSSLIGFLCISTYLVYWI